jgi:hypothetical protein
MTTFRTAALLFISATLLAGCGEPERPGPLAVVARPFRVSGDFDGVGKVSLFQGESCTSQIMFVFHRGKSTPISIAAPFRLSQILTAAAHDHKTVHITGKWRRGKAADCWYVEATQVEVRKSFW